MDLKKIIAQANKAADEQREHPRNARLLGYAVGINDGNAIHIDSEFRSFKESRAAAKPYGSYQVFAIVEVK